MDWALTSAENGGTVYQSGTASLTGTYLFTNQYGYDVYQEGFMVNAPLPAGSYWINLQNATTNSGEPVWWDQNSGPSLASENSVGTMPSEAFTVVGNGGSTTPEPGSLVLFASGVAGLLGVMRRRRA